MDDDRDGRLDPERMCRRLREIEAENERMLRDWYEEAGAPMGEERYETWVGYGVWTTVN